MNKKISATSAKNNFGSVLEDVYVRGDTVVIYKNKKPVAKLSPLYTYSDRQPSKTLALSDSDYDKIKEGMQEFRKTFKFDF